MNVFLRNQTIEIPVLTRKTEARNEIPFRRTEEAFQNIEGDFSHHEMNSAKSIEPAPSESTCENIIIASSRVHRSPASCKMQKSSSKSIRPEPSLSYFCTKILVYMHVTSRTRLQITTRSRAQSANKQHHIRAFCIHMNS